MKPRNHLTRFSIQETAPRAALPRRLAGAAWVVAAGTVLGLVIGTPVMGAVDSCRQAAQNAGRSCRAGAQADFWLALGKCSNLADSVARNECMAAARAERKDALDTCLGQDDARRALCRRLGGFPYAPPIDPAHFVPGISNPLLPMVPGTTFIYEGQTGEGFEHNEVFVTHNTRVILGVTCIEVHDTVKVDGVLTEDTLDWFAQDEEGNVWYFGEHSEQLVGGEIAGLEGTWRAGVGTAEPGIVMEAHPSINDIYRQEFLLGTAEDTGEVLSLTESVAVPAGTYNNCLVTNDVSALEPDALEHKFYARGVGVVLERDMQTGAEMKLVQVTSE
jgi:hypothetical protein